MYLILDGRAIPSREALHDLLAEMLALPEYYGRNLDALYDCLTDFSQPLDVILLHTDTLEENLGGYADALQQLLQDSAAENDKITIYHAEAE